MKTPRQANRRGEQGLPGGHWAGGTEESPRRFVPATRAFQTQQRCGTVATAADPNKFSLPAPARPSPPTHPQPGEFSAGFAGRDPHVAQRTHHLEHLTAGGKHPATGPFVLLERPHEFQFLRLVIPFAGRRINLTATGPGRALSDRRTTRAVGSMLAGGRHGFFFHDGTGCWENFRGMPAEGAHGGLCRKYAPCHEGKRCGRGKKGGLRGGSLSRF